MKITEDMVDYISQLSRLQLPAEEKTDISRAAHFAPRAFLCRFAVQNAPRAFLCLYGGAGECGRRMREANAAGGKCGGRQMRREANAAGGKCDGRQMRREANAPGGECGGRMREANAAGECGAGS